jgi:hypothetical protein
MAKIEGIDFPTIKTVKFSKLQTTTLNRDILVSHVTTMEGSIREFGFMDVIKVFPVDKNGMYTIAESSHRYYSLSILFGDTDPELPVAIIDWIDAEEQEQVQAAIIALNVKGKGWITFDYAKSYSEVKGKPTAPLFKEIYENMKKLQGILSNGIIASCYTKQKGVHKAIRDGSLTVSELDRFYVDKLIDRLPKLVSQKGEDKVKHQFIRRYVWALWLAQDKILDSNNKPDFLRWSKLFEHTIKDILYVTGPLNHSLPDGDTSFAIWWEHITESFGIRLTYPLK